MEPGRTGQVLQEQYSLEGEDYKIVAFQPSKAFKLAVKLTKLIGEPLATLAGGSGDEAKVAEILPLAMRTLTQKLDEDQVLNLIKELLSCVAQGSSMVNFETHFQGRLGHMLKLTAKVIEVQFKDFFMSIGELVGQLKKAA